MVQANDIPQILLLLAYGAEPSTRDHLDGDSPLSQVRYRRRRRCLVDAENIDHPQQ